MSAPADDGAVLPNPQAWFDPVLMEVNSPTGGIATGVGTASGLAPPMSPQLKHSKVLSFLNPQAWFSQAMREENTPTEGVATSGVALPRSPQP